MEHPEPTNSTKYKLFGSSQSCAYPGCSELHIVVDANTGIKTCNSQVCHICARSENGPRWNETQTPEENRSDGNLLLLCRKHHAIVDDPRNAEFYTANMLTDWKRDQEAQGAVGLDATDIEAIDLSGTLVIAEKINLGGTGGNAPGAGGGGGGAIGKNSRGGDGGDGARFYKDGKLADPSVLKPWMALNDQLPVLRPAGSGGHGVGAIGNGSRGGRGGDAGDVHVGRLKLEAGQHRVVVGRGGRLPGEFAGETRIERLEEDGSAIVIKRVQGGMSGESYLPNDVPELNEDTIANGFKVNCLAICDDATLENGVFSLKRIGWSRVDLSKVPSDVTFKVITIVTKSPAEHCGFYVSLFFEGEERARVAITAPKSDQGFHSISQVRHIGAEIHAIGECRLIAHCNGLLLNETVVEIREAT